MKRAGKLATYGLETCRDMLSKLEWEQEGLKEALERAPPVPNELYFRAFNAAITALHLADWVWHDMTPEHRKQLETKWKIDLNTEDKKGGTFKHELRNRNREFAICREIGTASKHVEITQSPDDTIDTIASAITSAVHDSDGNQIMVGDSFVVNTRWKLKVKDGEARRDLIEVIDHVLAFWTEFIECLAIGSGKLPA